MMKDQIKFVIVTIAIVAVVPGLSTIVVGDGIHGAYAQGPPSSFPGQGDPQGPPAGVPVGPPSTPGGPPDRDDEPPYGPPVDVPQPQGQ